MEYRVKITTGKKKESVAVGRDGRLLVSVQAPREKGKANERMRELLAQYFTVSPDAITIRRGQMSSSKVIFVKQKSA
ncbi:MAG: hypothetical protein A2942_03105 [Candidatus Lloydbacteria bacterium RIFCSPLOWO2_01_FULL_50_20]|uniref:Uncharacterized protein n=1 Tax=Candidatus Lloydbacteria bacterium RIFCSPLOWO2_01_FULL_50_20 TaxID=1798665 RepID=A0A1G2DHU5_9BACT|nr:MAG: hypothetical protein A3C13_04640 [Candidatus Lloydbacteria bacterium RIFCSPHIGHO2_02_FULL_50_11]OGZ13215.1 MAG: hypothetical protein A2942_03105 [Candidatus Lloydbacteria bacterium RIFCSPLOWO2_01_FULL_50_20]